MKPRGDAFLGAVLQLPRPPPPWVPSCLRVSRRSRSIPESQSAAPRRRPKTKYTTNSQIHKFTNARQPKAVRYLWVATRGGSDGGYLEDEALFQQGRTDRLCVYFHLCLLAATKLKVLSRPPGVQTPALRNGECVISACGDGAKANALLSLAEQVQARRRARNCFRGAQA